MSEPDDRLLGHLAAAIEAHDAVPDHLVERARAAWTWRTVDADLAELRVDSAVEAAGVRGMAWPRQLSFETPDAAIELEIDHGRLLGQVVPPEEVEVTATSTSGFRAVVRADAAGHFVVSGVAGQTLRIRAERGDGSIVTQWFTV